MQFFRASSRVVAMVAGSWLVVGCKTAPKPVETVACVGTPYLLVRNATDRTIDIYYSSGGVTPQLLGTAGVGPTESTLPPGVEGGFRARDPEGKWIVPAFGGQRDASRITYEVRCR